MQDNHIMTLRPKAVKAGHIIARLSPAALSIYLHERFTDARTLTNTLDRIYTTNVNSNQKRKLPHED